MRLTGRTKVGLVAALLGALLMLAAVAGFAQNGQQQGPPPGGPGGPRGERGPRGPRGGPGGPIPFLRDLNLTDAQKAQVKQIVDSFEASTKELREKMRGLRGPEGDALGGTFDEAAVRSAAQARAAVQVEMEVAHARMLSQVYNVLTAEQKATLAERRQQFEQRRREGQGERGDRPEDN